MTTSPQIWLVTLHQKNYRNQECRQEFYILATTAEEASQMACARKDDRRGRTLVNVDVEPRGAVISIHD